ncbi:hypothetical protein M8J77_022689 [Diaphorina citri]|nr:hypothetical protein M8J77_022689 [Diaphorina citri]
MSATSEQGGSTLSINYVDKFIPDRQPRPSAANMNENRHQIHQLLLQAGDDTTRTTQRQVRLPSGADTTRTTKPNAVFTGKSAARGYDAMSRNAPSVNTPRDNLETGGKDVLRTANKEGLSSNELLFRRIVNMFNKSYIWTTLKYGRSGGSRKRGRLFRKKYKGGGCSDSLLVGSDSNEVYRSDSFKFERFPKGGPNDGVVRIMEDEHGRNTRNCVWRAERGLTTAFHKLNSVASLRNPASSSRGMAKLVEKAWPNL